ncbi:MAG: hypothetical protein WCT27_00015 [Patescibacteria group bacterium]|jgi:hypothetical protein
MKFPVEQILAVLPYFSAALMIILIALAMGRVPASRKGSLVLHILAMVCAGYAGYHFSIVSWVNYGGQVTALIALVVALTLTWVFRVTLATNDRETTAFWLSVPCCLLVMSGVHGLIG